ncbi:hypothetical protein [Lacinutrix chionoecetis]
MKNALKLTIVLFLTVNFSFAQDCNSLHIGKFQLNDDRIDLRCIIERTETEQTELNLNTGEIFTGSIEWIDHCSYIFTYLKTNSENPAYQVFIGKKMRVDITKIENNNIFFDAVIDDMDFKMSYFMTRIE